MVCQHPLHYLLGLEGLALLQTFAGDHDRDFGEERVAQIRRLPADPALAGEGVTAQKVDTVTGYWAWGHQHHGPESPGAWDTWPWSLRSRVPAAVLTASPAVMLWHFRRD